MRCGVAPPTVRGWVRRGLCTSPKAGVYVIAGTPPSPQQQLWVGLLAVGFPVAATGLTNLWCRGLVAIPPAQPQLVVPDQRNPRIAGVLVRRVHHWASMGLQWQAGVPLVSPAVALLHAAAGLDDPQTLTLVQRMVFDGALSLDEIRAVNEGGARGSARLRRSCACYELGIDSPSELDIYELLRRGRRQPDHCNVALRAPDGRQSSPVDGYLELGLAYDYDGRESHEGFAATRRDDRKTALLESMGVPLLRLDNRHRRSARLLYAAMDQALAALGPPPRITVVHDRRRRCVCDLWKPIERRPA